MVIEDYRVGKCGWCTWYGRRYASSFEELEIIGKSPAIVTN
jgi:hypothetical protein